MQIQLIRTYRGPSAVSPNPVLLWTHDLTIEQAEAQVQTAWTALRASYPALIRNVQQPQVDARVSMAFLASVCAKGLMNSVKGLIADSGATITPGGQIFSWVGYHEAGVAREALKVASTAIADAGKDAPSARVAASIDAFKRKAAANHPNYISRMMLIGARKHGIPATPSLAGMGMWDFGWGSAGKTFLEAASNGDGCVGMQIARSKRTTRLYLSRLGFPATEHTFAADADGAVAAAAAMRGRVVVKPSDRGKGHGVTVGIEEEGDIRAAFAEARRWTSEPVLIERFVPGHDHRLLVLQGKLVAAARREPASVTGDGKHTIRELVDALNRQRASNPVTARYLYPVAIDQTLIDQLRRQNADPDTVPPSASVFTLRSNANVSTGGTPTDVLAAVHPDVREMAEAIARNTGMNAIGIDYITTDIARSWRETGGAVIEINATPGTDVHVASGMDEADLGANLIGQDVGRIPVAVVIAPRPEQTALIDALQATISSWPAHWRCGVLGPNHVQIGATRVTPSAKGLHERISQVLQNRDSKTALLCVTPEEIEQGGFPVDKSALTILFRPGGVTDALATRHSRRMIRWTGESLWPGNAVLSGLIDLLGPEGSR